MVQQIQGFAVLLRAVVLLQPFWLEALKFVTAGYLVVTTSRTCDLISFFQRSCISGNDNCIIHSKVDLLLSNSNHMSNILQNYPEFSLLTTSIPKTTALAPYLQIGRQIKAILLK